MAILPILKKRCSWCSGIKYGARDNDFQSRETRRKSSLFFEGDVATLLEVEKNAKYCFAAAFGFPLCVPSILVSTQSSEISLGYYYRSNLGLHLHPPHRPLSTRFTHTRLLRARSQARRCTYLSLQQCRRYPIENRFTK